MAWQRRVVESDDIEDTTDFGLFNEGDEVCWIAKDVVLCPNCGRKGLEFDNGIVHVAGPDNYVFDTCVNDAQDTDPRVIILNEDGEVIRTEDGRDPSQYN